MKKSIFIAALVAAGMFGCLWFFQYHAMKGKGNKESPLQTQIVQIRSPLNVYIEAHQGAWPASWDQVEKYIGVPVWGSDAERTAFIQSFALLGGIYGRIKTREEGEYDSTLMMVMTVPVEREVSSGKKEMGRWVLWKTFRGQIVTRWHPEAEIKSFSQWPEVERAIEAYQIDSKSYSSSAAHGMAPGVPAPEPPPNLSITAIFSTPIRFFGKVQNQNGDPVTGAQVSVAVADKFGGGSSKLGTQSDTQGGFSFTTVGMAISVRVAKEGYYSIPETSSGSPRSSGMFNYGADVGGGIHQPSREKPVIFTLFLPPPSESLNRIREREILMPGNDTPVTIALDVPERALELRFRADEFTKERDGRYDWSLEVAVKKGRIRGKGPLNSSLQPRRMVIRPVA